MSQLPARLILYDGECGFCSRSVQFVLDRDAQEHFYFAPLQGDTAESLRARHTQIPTGLDTMVLIRVDEGVEQVFLRSAAVLRVASELPGIWRVVGCLKILPSMVTDLFYRPVAAIRHRLAGSRKSCRLIQENEAHRFLP